MKKDESFNVLSFKGINLGVPYFYKYAKINKIKGDTPRDAKIHQAINMFPSEIHETRLLDQKPPFKPITIL